MKKYNLTALVAFSFIASATQTFAMEAMGDAFEGTAPGGPVTAASAAVSPEAAPAPSVIKHYFDGLIACEKTEKGTPIVQELFTNVIANTALPAQERAEGMELALGMGFKSLLATGLLKPTLNQLNTFMMKAEKLGTTANWLNTFLEAGLVTDPKTKALMQKLSARIHQKTHLKTKDIVIARDGNANVMFEGDDFKDIHDHAATRIKNTLKIGAPSRALRRTVGFSDALSSATTTENFYKFFMGHTTDTKRYTRRFEAFSASDKEMVLGNLFTKVIANTDLPVQDRAKGVELALGMGFKSLLATDLLKPTLNQLNTFMMKAETLGTTSHWLNQILEAGLVTDPKTKALMQKLSARIHQKTHLKTKDIVIARDGNANVMFEGDDFKKIHDYAITNIQKIARGHLARKALKAPVTVSTVEPIAALAPVEEGDGVSVVTTASGATLETLNTAPSSVSALLTRPVVSNPDDDSSWRTEEEEDEAAGFTPDASLSAAELEARKAEDAQLRAFRGAQIEAEKAARVDGVVEEGKVAGLAVMFGGKKSTTK